MVDGSAAPLDDRIVPLFTNVKVGLLSALFTAVRALVDWYHCYVTTCVCVSERESSVAVAVQNSAVADKTLSCS